MKTPSDFKIMTVDDDEQIRSSLSSLLEVEGFQTVHAKNGRVALDYLSAIPDEKLPDLILLDYMMPVMNGGIFCKAKAAIPRLVNIPVVMMTAGGNALKVMDCIEKDAHAYLQKPMEADSLLNMIEHFLNVKVYHEDLELPDVNQA